MKDTEVTVGEGDAFGSPPIISEGGNVSKTVVGVKDLDQLAIGSNDSNVTFPNRIHLET